MLTMGKVCAGVLFGALAWYVSELIIPLFPEGLAPGRFSVVNAAISVVLGWRIAGSRAGDGWSASLSYGLTTAVAIVVSCLFLQCFGEMVRNSLKKFYDGPVEALTDVFSLMAKYGQVMLDAQVIGTLVIGGLVAGLITEAVGRNFR